MNDSELTQFVTQHGSSLLRLCGGVVASVVGVIVSLVQALTQIQDQNATVPPLKLLAIANSIMVSYPWLSGIL